MGRHSAFAIAFVALLVIGGCTPPGPPNEPPGIEGTITRIDPGDGDTLLTILVEVPDAGVADPSFVSDKASVRITDATEFFSIEGAPGDASEIDRPGLAVRVWFDGPVAESYPVQGTASALQFTP